MNGYLLMTPGPTEISEPVRAAMARNILNPDLDLDFYELYKKTCEQFQKLIYTKNETLILSGEGILGLEAACASLIEPGDAVLCIENGIFGRGFSDFINMYGGDCTFYSGDSRKGLNFKKFETFLKKNNDFKVATLVHCETPSGITNDIEPICKLLKAYGILTVVDSVSAFGGENLKVDDWGIDIMLGASQKCLSAAPGLTLLSLSDDAKAAMKNRKTPIIGYYCNLSIWENWYEEKWFPYTPPISDIYGLEVALDRALFDKNFQNRHKSVGRSIRKALIESGLELYPLDYHSNTVTAILKPEALDFDRFFLEMKEKHGILIAGAFGPLKNKVIRIGHMGENCRAEKVAKTLKALKVSFATQGIILERDLEEDFLREYGK